MRIFYRKSDNKFCGAGNIDKLKASDDEILNIEIEEQEWIKFVQSAQDIYVIKNKLVSKEIELTKEQKILQIDAETSNNILNVYPIYKQINITNLIGYTDEDRQTMIKFILEKRNEGKQKKSLIK